jgi:hypothetical protein
MHPDAPAWPTVTAMTLDHNEFFSDLDHGIDFYDGQVDVTHGVTALDPPVQGARSALPSSASTMRSAALGVRIAGARRAREGARGLAHVRAAGHTVSPACGE